LSGDEAAYNEIAKLIGKIGELYPAHIEKEDKHFFLPVMGYFSEEEQAGMLAEFYEFDRSSSMRNTKTLFYSLKTTPAP
jgi:hemerythrin-like domain-containing protein